MISHKAAESESQLDLESLEVEKPSEEKIKKIYKDILGLQAESDLMLFRHIPEMVNKIDGLTDNLFILREDHADTNRLVRKMYYEQIPALHAKVDTLTEKTDTLNQKIDLLCTKIDGLLKE